MSVSESGSLIRSNIFDGNISAEGYTGAAIYGNNASPRIEQNIFRNNICDSQYLAAVVTFSSQSSPILVNNIFEDNLCRALNVILPGTSHLRVLNNTFVRNPTAIRTYGGEPTANHVYENNILFDNPVGFDVQQGSAASNPTWKHNLVFGGNAYSGIPSQTGVNGNISADPLFACAGNGGYPLRPDSPAIDAGDNLAPDLPANDFANSMRSVDGNMDGSPIADIGAYEFSGQPNLVLSSTSFTFPDQTVGTRGEGVQLDLFNAGPGTFVFCDKNVTTHFALTGDCGISLLEGRSCQLKVAFAPLLQGEQSGKLTVTMSGVSCSSSRRTAFRAFSSCILSRAIPSAFELWRGSRLDFALPGRGGAYSSSEDLGLELEYGAHSGVLCH